MRIKILALYICLFAPVVAQNNPQIDWIKTYETLGTQGVYFGEFVRDNFDHIYYYSVEKWTKLDLEGNKIIEFVEYSDSNHTIFGSSIAIDSNQNIYTTYIKKNEILPVSFSVVLKKYSRNGQEEWSKVYDGLYPTHLILDSNENPILGYFGESKIMINKYSQTGDTLWSKSFEGFDGISGLYENNDNIYFLAVESIVNTDPPEENSYLYKLNSIGEILWTRENVIFPICLDQYSNVILRDKSGTISKLDPNGNFLWQTEIFFPTDIKIDNNNNIIVAGSYYDLSGVTGRNFLVGKISEDGNVKWVREFNSPEGDYSLDEPFDFEIDSDNSIYITGRSSRGDTYCYTLKYSEDGEMVYQFKLQNGSFSSYLGNKIFIENGGYYLCGTSDNTTIYVAKIIDSSVSDIPDDSKLIVNYSLSQNYPNPFNPSTTISYSISKNNFVQLKVFDVLGKEVATLVNEEKQIGNYEVKFDASHLPSGVYFYRLKSDDFINTKKLILLR